MAVSSLASSPASSALQQLQNLQAQRIADQAEQNARALRQKSDVAQQVANRAQQNAHSLKVQSDRAEDNASSARLGLATRQALSDFGERVTGIYQRISAAQQENTPQAPAVAVTVAPAQATTGTVIDTTA